MKARFVSRPYGPLSVATATLAFGSWVACANSGDGSDSEDASAVEGGGSSGATGSSSSSSSSSGGVAATSSSGGSGSSGGMATSSSSSSSSGTGGASSSSSGSSSGSAPTGDGGGGNLEASTVVSTAYDATGDYSTSCGACTAGEKCVGTYGGTTCAQPCPGNGQCPPEFPNPYCDSTGGVECVAN